MEIYSKHSLSITKRVLEAPPPTPPPPPPPSFFFFLKKRYLTPLYTELARAPLDSDTVELPRFPWWEAYRGQRVHAVRPALLAELKLSIQRLRSIVESRQEYRFPKERRLSVIHMFSDATLKQCGVEIVAEGSETFGLVPTAEGRLRWGATFAEAIHGIPLAAKNTGVTESECVWFSFVILFFPIRG